MISKRRITRWTDTRGVPRQDLRGLFEVVWLQRFESAGIPKAWLHPSGAHTPFGSEAWESEGDLDGCFADGLYMVGQGLQGLADDGNPDPGACERLKATVDLMGRLASKVGCGLVVASFRDGIKDLLPEYRSVVADGYAAIQRAWDAGEDVKPLWREQLKRIHGVEAGEAAYAEIYEGEESE